MGWTNFAAVAMETIPPFLFPWQLRQSFVLPIPIFLAYLVPLDVDVTGNINANICEVCSEFNIFCTLVTTAMADILNEWGF
jgi:hypothetical protein